MIAAGLSTVVGALLSLLSFGLLFGWILWRWSQRSEDPPAILIPKVVVSVVLFGVAGWCILRIHPLLGVPLGAVCGIIIGVLWGRNIGSAIANPLASLYDGGGEAPEPTPFYAIAIAHRKQARYAQAIEVIEQQLERFPGDVQGLLLLAEIRGRNLGDWAGAAAAIEAIVCQHDLPVAPRAKALQALADWNLDFAANPQAAHELLQRIQDLFPGTSEAQEAAQRQAHLGDAAWRETRTAPARLHIVPGDPHLGLKGGSLPEPPPEADPESEATALCRHLAEYPLDAEARENLAVLYADRMGRLDWAVAELEKLLAQSNEAPKRVARRLHLLADLQVRCAGDEAAARNALRRIVDALPNTAHAANAQSRLEHLKLEMRVRQPARHLKASDQAGNG